MARVRGKLVVAGCLSCSICLLYAVFQLNGTGKDTSCGDRATFKPMCNPGALEKILTSKPAVVKKGTKMVLTTVNAAYLKMAENMLASIQRIRTPSFPNVTVITEDKQSYEYMTNLTIFYQGLIVQKTSAGLTTSEKLKLNTKTYNNFVNRRPRYVLELLEKGYDVLFADTDSFWRKDPFTDFEGDFDIAAHDEVHRPRKPVFCDGFVLYHPTNNTISLVREWVTYLETTKGCIADQKVFNCLINRELDRNVAGGLKMKTLNPVNYPDGKLYYRVPGWRDEHINQTIVIHFTYLNDLASKVKEIQKLGWWLV